MEKENTPLENFITFIILIAIIWGFVGFFITLDNTKECQISVLFLCYQWNDEIINNNNLNEANVQKAEKIDINSYATEEFEKEFPYKLNSKTYTFSTALYKGVNEYLENLPRSISYSSDEDEPTDRDFIDKYLNNNVQSYYLESIVKYFKQLNISEEQKIRKIIALIQNIPYDNNDNDKSAKYPYEVLYKNKGVCSEKSYLLIYFLKEFDYSTVYFSFEKENHGAVGIKCPTQYSYKNSGYCFIETTSPNIITDSYGEYVNAGKLVSTPKIIKISNGKSFNNVEQDFYDAYLYAKMQDDEMIKKNNFEEYIKIRYKYGLYETSEDCDNDEKLCQGICYPKCSRGDFRCESSGATCYI